MDDDPRTYGTLTAADDTEVLALELHGVTKRFGAFTALDNVSLPVRARTIHALLGENGAGKTTLMRVAFGLLRPDAAVIRVNGAVTSITTPADAIAAGIGMVHQQFSLVPAMTVAENVALGGTGMFRSADMARRIAEIGEETGIVLNPLARVQELTAAERQKLEIVRTLAHNAEILIMDEPTAVLTPQDFGDLFGQLRKFADSGGCVILITHKLRYALEHANDVTVLRKGTVEMQGSMEGVTQHDLTTAMIGEAPERKYSAPSSSTTRSVAASLQAVPLSGRADRKKLTANIEARTGEILGVAALEGTGKEVLLLLAGRIRPLSGSVERPERIGYVPENRQDDALVPQFSLTENLALKDAGVRRGLMRWTAFRSSVEELMKQFDVRASGPEATAQTLSGGNQQRFVLGRELQNSPQLLILDNPTQGLDVNAASSIHQKIRSAADAGAAVVMYSSDIDELADICDRVIVIADDEIAVSAPDRDSIGRLLLGTSTNEFIAR